MGGIAPSPNGSTSVGIERAWSYIKLLRSESMGISALFWKNRVCANDMSKAEALREKYENVFTWEDLNNVPILPESHTRIFRIWYTFNTRGIQKLLESTRPDKASGPDQIPACVLNESALNLPLSSLHFSNNHLIKVLYHPLGGMQTSLPSLKRDILLTLKITDLCL